MEPATGYRSNGLRRKSTWAAPFDFGERSATTKLEEALAAYRQALRELTYERAPSLWAITVGSEGVVLMHLAERRADVAMAEGAVNLINTAFELMRDGGGASAAAYYERELASARASVVRLRGP